MNRSIELDGSFRYRPNNMQDLDDYYGSTLFWRYILHYSINGIETIVYLEKNVRLVSYFLPNTF